METLKKHGGKRDGSGRKPLITKKTVSVCLDIELIEKAKADGLCLSKELNKALKMILLEKIT